MLTFTEELLLLLGDGAGAYLPARQHALECALAGAVLLDLAFADRIDTDLEALVVTDPAPTGNAMLDRILSKITARADTADTQTWIRELATGEADTIREQALADLVGRGILERRGERLPWAFGPVRHVTLDDGPGRGIRARIEAALTDDIPDPRDVALVALADACQLLPELFPERAVGSSRIAQLRRMDLIGVKWAGPSRTSSVGSCSRPGPGPSAIGRCCCFSPLPVPQRARERCSCPAFPFRTGSASAFPSASGSVGPGSSGAAICCSPSVPWALRSP